MILKTVPHGPSPPVLVIGEEEFFKGNHTPRRHCFTFLVRRRKKMPHRFGGPKLEEAEAVH